MIRQSKVNNADASEPAMPNRASDTNGEVLTLLHDQERIHDSQTPHEVSLDAIALCLGLIVVALLYNSLAPQSYMVSHYTITLLYQNCLIIIASSMCTYKVSLYIWIKKLV